MTGAYAEDSVASSPPQVAVSEEKKNQKPTRNSLSCENTTENPLQLEEDAHEGMKVRTSATGAVNPEEKPKETSILNRQESDAKQEIEENERKDSTQKEENNSLCVSESKLEKSSESSQISEVIENHHLLPKSDSLNGSFENETSSFSAAFESSFSLLSMESLSIEESTKLDEASQQVEPVGVDLGGTVLDPDKPWKTSCSLEIQERSSNSCVENHNTKKEVVSREQCNTEIGCFETLDMQGNLHEAVRAGDDKCVAALLSSGKVQNLDEPDWNVSGDPPLLVAATNHSLPILSLLLANGCEPGVRSPRGENALHRAILSGTSAEMVQSLVEELLKYGCPAAVKEAGGGLTALHLLARQLAHAQASKSLRRNFDAALRTLELLAKAGPVNAKDHQGRSALHILASSTSFDANQTGELKALIESLLAAGADPSLKNDRGETPLHESLECGALSTAFLLIPHTPNGVTSRYGETPLHIASRKNYADIVAKLLEHGEDPSIQDAGGNTALHLASARGYHQTVSLLVTSPLAQLEKPNSEGLTALQVAAESGFVNAVKLLLKAGADPTQTVHYYATTLYRHPDISLLIDHELTRRRQLAA